jgi:hypothetical protein
MNTNTGGFVNSLPIESTRWREVLKQRIALETAILRALIEWGMAESAVDVCRSLDEHFGADLETHQLVRPSGPDRAFVRELLREAYLRTRDIPRRAATQERLHDGMLTGFEDLALAILCCYERFRCKPEYGAQTERAA